MEIARLWLLFASMLWVMCWSGQRANGQGVGLSLNGVNYTNNSIVTRTDIGTYSAALLCTTTYSPCCSSRNIETQWFFPDGNQVVNDGGLPYYRSRSSNPGTLLLNRNPEGTTTGIFRCDILDASGDTQSLYVTIYDAAGQPSDLAAVPAGPTSIIVSWTAPTTTLVTVTGYQINWSGGSDQGSMTANAGDTAVTISGHSPGLVYTISIMALSNQLPSPQVGLVMVTLAPSSPIIAMANSQSATSIDLTWTPEVGEIVMSYEVTFFYQGPCSGFTDSDNIPLGSGSRSRTLTGLQAFGSYTVSVTAVNDGGRSTPQTQTVTTMSAAPSGAPQMVMATATGRATIFVQWERVVCIDRNSDITGYMVSYGQRGNGDSETRTVMGTADRTYTVMGLNASTEYFVMVAAMNSDGATGPFSNPVFQQTLSPSIPGLVSSLQVTDASLMLPVTWNPPLNLTQSGDIIVYEVEFWDEEEGQEGGRIVNVTATSVELTGLRPESAYTISVRAYTAAGPGGERILTVPSVLTITPTTAITSQAPGSGSLAGAVVGACIGTALLYTVVLLVVIFALLLWNKRHREIQDRGAATKGTHFDTDMAMKECVAYGGVAVHSGAEEGIYENPP